MGIITYSLTLEEAVLSYFVLLYGQYQSGLLSKSERFWGRICFVSGALYPYMDIEPGTELIKPMLCWCAATLIAWTCWHQNLQTPAKDFSVSGISRPIGRFHSCSVLNLYFCLAFIPPVWVGLLNEEYTTQASVSARQTTARREGKTVGSVGSSVCLSTVCFYTLFLNRQMQVQQIQE